MVLVGIYGVGFQHIYMGFPRVLGCNNTMVYEGTWHEALPIEFSPEHSMCLWSLGYIIARFCSVESIFLTNRVVRVVKVDAL